MLYKVKIKYNPHLFVGGEFIEEETFTFSSEQERSYFLDGEIVYDYQESMVRIITTKYTVVRVWEEDI